MKPKNNFIEIELIDNTVINTDLQMVFTRGYSEKSRISIPNQGKLSNGDDIWFFNYGVYLIDGGCFINKQHIFMIDDKLTQDGMIVRSVPQLQKADGFDIRIQNFFQVDSVKMPWNARQALGLDLTIKPKDIIICLPETAYKFNKDGEQLWYLAPNNIMLHIGKGKINPGPDHLLLMVITEDNLLCSRPRTDCGLDIDTGRILYFKQTISEIQLEDGYYYVVAKSDIFAEE